MLSQAQHRDPDISVRQALASLFEEFQADSEVIRMFNFVLSGQIEQEYAGSADELSVHWYDMASGQNG